MINKNLMVKSLCSVLLIGALILSFNVISDVITVAGDDLVGGELVKANTVEIAGDDLVGGELVKANIVDIAGDDLVGGELVKAIKIYEGILV